MIEIKIDCKVNVDQFFGIEYEEFPCQIARVGMWLMDHQMNMRVAEHFGTYFARLPLKQAAAIVNGNALRLDWESVVPKHELSYILGNPPFVGYTFMNPAQKEDISIIFSETKKAGVLDYVSSWYMKAAQFIKDTRIEVAFVSTNSITQGEQVFALWKPLFEEYKITINFAYRTFKWNNEAKGRATVHCVIIGFSVFNRIRKLIYEDDKIINADNICPYLIDAPTLFIESRRTPLCDVPTIYKGSIPVDGGNLIIEAEDYDSFVEKEPGAKKYIRPLLGSQEYINNQKRWCLWLIDASPSELKKMPLVMERVEKVRKFRLSSPKLATQKYADYPTRFMEIRQPVTDYVVVPKVSSEKRNYVPMGFISSEVISSDLLFVIPDVTLYHFGVLTSNVHMAWMRAICGRLEMRYRYSAEIVYNNFAWPNPTDPQKQTIEQAAQGVLDARALYPESSLADLYDPLTMPPELTKAHNALDRAVKAAYGGKSFATEAERVADLMERYSRLVAQE